MFHSINGIAYSWRRCRVRHAKKRQQQKIAAEHDVWLYHRKAQMGALHTRQKGHRKRKYQIPTTQRRQHYSMHGMHNARPRRITRIVKFLHDGEMPSQATIRIITIQFFRFQLSVFSRLPTHRRSTFLQSHLECVNTGRYASLRCVCACVWKA